MEHYFLPVSLACGASEGAEKKTLQVNNNKLTTSNLKTHLERVHVRTKITPREDANTSNRLHGRKRKAEDNDAGGPVRKTTQLQLDFTRRIERLEPKEVKRLVAEYVVEDMKPLSTVESAAF